jgi:hypothetical protein
MHAIIYGILGEGDNGEIFIDGPYFHDCCENESDAEIQAKELAASKTKNQIMPWVFEINQGERIPDVMVRVRDGWFSRFKDRTMETHRTITRDHETSTCPFANVDVEKFIQHL